jgi:putative sterol carrier protein
MATCKEVFDAMPQGFDPEEAGDWEAVIQYNIEGDGGGSWVMTVKDGKCAVAEGATEESTAIVDSDVETWVGIGDGSVDATSAFMMGKIRIQGNMADVLKAQKVIKKDRIQ